MLSLPTPGLSNLGPAETDRAATATVSDVLRSASTAAYGHLADHAVNHRAPGGVTVSDLYDQPQMLSTLAETAGRNRFGCPDQSLTLPQIVREATAALTTSATYTWSCQRRLLDLRATNVTLRDGPIALISSVNSLRVAVLADDPLARSQDTGDVIEVVDEETMFSRLLEAMIGRPQPRSVRNEPSNGNGDVSDSRPRPVGAVTAIIDAARQLETMGDRHFWGTVAAAVAGALTKASHIVGARADDDRERVLAARPDLARLIELVTVSDATGEPLTFPVRRTCCLLYKLPQGARCATCSLGEREDQVAELTAWHLQARADARGKLSIRGEPA